MKLSYIIVGAVFIATVVLASVFWVFTKDSGKEANSTPDFVAVPLAPEVEMVLEAKASLIETLVRDPLIVVEVKKSNEEHMGIALEEIESLDKRWRQSDGVDNFIKAFLTNTVAQRVILFQGDNPGFSEIFVTDERGLNVGQTNKTTDYYQADEDWWVYAYNSGSGKTYHGPIEFDESAQAEAISIYAPVIDPDTGSAIGVVKAVLNTSAIKVQL